MWCFVAAAMCALAADRGICVRSGLAASLNCFDCGGLRSPDCHICTCLLHVLGALCGRFERRPLYADSALLAVLLNRPHDHHALFTTSPSLLPPATRYL